MNVTINTPFEVLLIGADPGIAANLRVEVYDPTDASTVLPPSGAGITEPRPRTYRATRTVSTPGTYSIRWTDAANGNAVVGEEDLNVYDAAASATIGLPTYTPDLPEIGALIRARTKDSNGNEIGTFNNLTRPTDTGVEELRSIAANDVVSKAGADLPEELLPMARTTVALRTAMLIELSYFPEQIRTDKSAYTHLRDLYKEKLENLLLAVVDVAGGGEEGAVDDPNFPVSGFPPNVGGMIGWGSRW